MLCDVICATTARYSPFSEAILVKPSLCWGLRAFADCRTVDFVTKETQGKPEWKIGSEFVSSKHCIQVHYAQKFTKLQNHYTGVRWNLTWEKKMQSALSGFPFGYPGFGRWNDPKTSVTHSRNFKTTRLTSNWIIMLLPTEEQGREWYSFGPILVI